MCFSLAATLLKKWVRELREPLLPGHLYFEAVHLVDAMRGCHDTNISHDRINDLIRKIEDQTSRLTLLYLIRFLKSFTVSQVVSVTKMNTDNLAMIFAPNILRHPQPESQNPLEFQAHAEKGLEVVKGLIKWLDTSEVESIPDWKIPSTCIKETMMKCVNTLQEAGKSKQ